MISSRLNLGLRERLKENIKWMFTRIWIFQMKIFRSQYFFFEFSINIEIFINPIFRFRVNLQQQFRAKISKISELEKHSHESITEETEKETEDPMFSNILRDTESYHLVIGTALRIMFSSVIFGRLLPVGHIRSLTRGGGEFFQSLKGFILLVALLALYIYYCEKRKRRLSAQVWKVQKLQSSLQSKSLYCLKNLKINFLIDFEFLYAGNVSNLMSF